VLAPDGVNCGQHREARNKGVQVSEHVPEGSQLLLGGSESSGVIRIGREEFRFEKGQWERCQEESKRQHELADLLIYGGPTVFTPYQLLGFPIRHRFGLFSVCSSYNRRTPSAGPWLSWSLLFFPRRISYCALHVHVTRYSVSPVLFPVSSPQTKQTHAALFPQIRARLPVSRTGLPRRLPTPTWTASSACAAIELTFRLEEVFRFCCERDGPACLPRPVPLREESRIECSSCMLPTRQWCPRKHNCGHDVSGPLAFCSCGQGWAG
jgi:hypothetical protein